MRANPAPVIFAVFASLALSLTILSCGIGRPGSSGDPKAAANKNAGAGRNPLALRVISLAPASTSILLDLGAEGLLVATDSWSTRLSGVPAGLPSFVRQMIEAVTRIEKIARTIPADKRRTVVFEIESAPWIYTFGSGTYLDDLLSRAGAINAFAREKGWIAVSAEAIIKANPDVILTNVVSADPVAEISERPGWGAVKAVREGRVYKIDNTASSQPAPACVRALEEIAEAVYPEYFK